MWLQGNTGGQSFPIKAVRKMMSFKLGGKDAKGEKVLRIRVSEILVEAKVS